MGYIIACDFDGTVTQTDTIIAIIKRFAHDEGNEIIRNILSQTCSIQEGVSALFNLLNSNDREAIIQFVLDEISIRPGFQHLLNFARKEHIPFYIISGGMHFFIDPILKQFTGVTETFANEVDFSAERMKVIWTHTCDEHCTNNCGTCKPSIVRSIAHGNKVIAIGDSVTDILLAQQAHIVFATDKLSLYATENNLQHYNFDTFYDVVNTLEEVVICQH